MKEITLWKYWLDSKPKAGEVGSVVIIMIINQHKQQTKRLREMLKEKQITFKDCSSENKTCSLF